MNFFDNLKNGTSDFCASVAAKYRCYVDAANAQARQNAKANAYAMAVNEWYPRYQEISGILTEAINNTAAITHLVPVDNSSQIWCSPWLYRTNGTWVFWYHALISRGHGMTANGVERILQSELNRLCGIHGYPGSSVHIRIDSDCQVKIAIC